MREATPAGRLLSWRRSRAWAAPLVAVLGVLGLSTVPAVRAVVAWPLCVQDEDPSGEVAYVMSAGHALPERLHAAAVLYHQGYVPRILVMNVERLDGLYPPAGRRWTSTEWSQAYLEWLGVPRDRVRVLPATDDALGSRGEARLVAAHLDGARRVVVVTSAAHTRRSRLAFERAVPPGVTVRVHGATSFLDSEEMHRPLFLEYLKLLVYAVVA